MSVANIDGNALFPLGFKPIEQKCKIDVSSGGAISFGIPFDPNQVIFEDQVLLVQQASNQSRFAVVNRAAGQNPQGWTCTCALMQRGLFVGGN
jgi:hypothetical protein